MYLYINSNTFSRLPLNVRKSYLFLYKSLLSNLHFFDVNRLIVLDVQSSYLLYKFTNTHKKMIDFLSLGKLTQYDLVSFSDVFRKYLIVKRLYHRVSNVYPNIL